MKPKTKQVVFTAIWFAILIAAFQFLTPKHRAIEVYAAWVLIGAPLYWFFCMRTKPN
jgi:hypothetical protein